MLEPFALDAFVDDHPDDPGIAALQPLVHAAISMSSVRNDLKRAGEMMEACKALSASIRTAMAHGDGPRRDQAATVQALFAQAVLLYTRATHSSGKGRNKLQITAHLDAEARALHDRITGLRDRYLAHFGDASGWEAHRAVLAIDLEDARMALSYPHSSAYIQVDEALDFERLLGLVWPIAEAHYGKVSHRLNLALNDLFETDPDLLEKLRAGRFDPASFFDADEVQPYLDSVGTLDPDAPTEPRVGGRSPPTLAQRRGQGGMTVTAHGAATGAHSWLGSIGTWVYDYQTLIAAILAIGAAYYAARPVWRQLKDSNLQTEIQHRETLASLLRESQDRFARVSKSIAQPLLDLDRLTIDPAGEPMAINGHTAFEMEQRLQGELDWYLVDLKATKADEIELAKTRLKGAHDDLLRTLNDVHWCEHNEQHDEDHSIPDDEWAAILARSKEAETLSGEKVAAARAALRALEQVQAAWITGLRGRIGKLDRELAIAS